MPEVTVNHWVGGSSPSRGAMFHKGFGIFGKSRRIERWCCMTLRKLLLSIALLVAFAIPSVQASEVEDPCCTYKRGTKLTVLNEDPLSNIFSYLTYQKSLTHISKTCKNWKLVIDWSEIYKGFLTPGHVDEFMAMLLKCVEQKRPIKIHLDILNTWALSERKLSAHAQSALGKLLFNVSIDPQISIITKFPSLEPEPLIQKVNFNTQSFEEFCKDKEMCFWPNDLKYWRWDPIEFGEKATLDFFNKHGKSTLCQIFLSFIILDFPSKHGIKEHPLFPVIKSLYENFKDKIKPLEVLRQASFSSFSFQELENMINLANYLKRGGQLEDTVILSNLDTWKQNVLKRIYDGDMEHICEINIVDQEFYSRLIMLPDGQAPNFEFTQTRQEIFQALTLKKNMQKFKGNPTWYQIMANVLMQRGGEESYQGLYYNALYASLEEKKYNTPYPWSHLMKILGTGLSTNSNISQNLYRFIKGEAEILKYYLEYDVNDLKIGEYGQLWHKSSHIASVLGGCGNYFQSIRDKLESLPKDLIPDAKALRDESEFNIQAHQQLLKALKVSSNGHILGTLASNIWALNSSLTVDERIKRTLDYIDQSVIDFMDIEEVYIFYHFCNGECFENANITDWSKPVKILTKFIERGVPKELVLSTINNSIKSGYSKYAHFLKEALEKDFYLNSE
jgi:hypothetical protein